MNEPDVFPIFASVLLDEWVAEERDGDRKPTALGTRLRHSSAGKCSRYIGLEALRVEPSNPIDPAGVWVTRLGTQIHEWWQKALERKYPGAQIELKVGWDELDASGHLDALLEHEGKRIQIELKTKNGSAYKRALGIDPYGRPSKYGVQGPSGDNRAQSALNSLAVDADEMVIVYLATEAISIQAAERCGISQLGRVMSQWTYDRAVIEQIANAEHDRMTMILNQLDAGVLPGRFYEGKEIKDPTKVGFPCGYCSQLDNCVLLGSVATVDQARAVAPQEVWA